MRLISISNIKFVFDTGQKPILITCSDLEDYACKHSFGNAPSKILFVEWLAYHFLKKLEVYVPELALVKIQDHHTLSTQNCQPIFFKNTTCFATKFMEFAEETNLININSEDFKHLANKKDLFMIAFTDIWMANEDRNHNNFNMLHQVIDGKTFVIPIDHGSCLNTLGFDIDRNLYQIEYSDSLISTDLFQKVSRGYVKNMQEVPNLLEMMYICVLEIEQYYDEIVANTPKDWKIPADYVHSLKQNLFDENWLDETKTKFLSYCKTSLKLK
jgi:hypothetical protein